jgi:signal transduction histidine kinase
MVGRRGSEFWVTCLWIVVGGTLWVLDLFSPLPGAFFGGMVVAGLLYLVISQIFVDRPAGKLREHLVRLTEGENVESPVVLKGKDGFARLTQAIGDLTTKLRKSRIADEEKVSRAQLAARSVIDALPHAVAIFSVEGRVDLVNAVAESLFKLRSVSPTDMPNWLADLLGRVRKTGESVTGKPMQIFDGGRELFFTPRASPLLDESKGLVGILVILENATDLRQVEEAKSGLVASVSHELKTPLTSIQMAVHLLLDNPTSILSERERELLKTAGEDADRLNGLIQKLLDKGSKGQ